jgi:hypothetical protein
VRTLVVEDVPERRKIVRSTVVTVLFTLVFLLCALAFWAWSSPEVIDQSPVGYLNGINRYVVYVLEILSLFGFFAFLTITVVNLRLGLAGVRAGWMDLLLMLVIIGIVSYAMFGAGIAAATLILSMGFIGYLYLLQD